MHLFEKRSTPWEVTTTTNEICVRWGVKVVDWGLDMRKPLSHFTVVANTSSRPIVRQQVFPGETGYDHFGGCFGNSVGEKCTNAIKNGILREVGGSWSSRKPSSCCVLEHWTLFMGIEWLHQVCHCFLQAGTGSWLVTASWFDDSPLPCSGQSLVSRKNKQIQIV